MSKCVVCDRETKGTFCKKFPVCYFCYTEGKLAKLFYKIGERHAMHMNPSSTKVMSEVIESAKEWYDKYDDGELDEN